MRVTVEQDPGGVCDTPSQAAGRPEIADPAWAPFVQPLEAMTSPVTLETQLDISGAVALKARLLEALSASEALDVDAREVTHVDAAAAQVLVAFALTAREQGRAVRWQLSAPLKDFLERTALAPALTPED